MRFALHTRLLLVKVPSVSVLVLALFLQAKSMGVAVFQ